MIKEEFRNVCKLAWEKPYGFVVVDLTSNICKKAEVYTRLNGASHIENCKNYKKVITHPEIQDGGRRHLGFSDYVNLAIRVC